MKKRAKICFYIFITCAVFALGILGYFVFNNDTDDVMIGSRKFVTFNEVPGAASYSVSVNDSPEYIANYKVEKKATDNENEYSFKIEVSLPGGTKLATENYIQEITSKNTNEKTIDCIIKNYTVDFFNSLGEKSETFNFRDQELESVDENIFCCIVSEYFASIFNSDGKYKISFSAYDSLGNKIENSEKDIEYSYNAYYEREFARREPYYINGKEYDYIISTQEELERLVWHTVLYRNDNVSFYIKTSSINSRNINSLVYNAIADYPEYDAVEDSRSYAKIEENIGTLINFDYYLEENFTKTYEDLEEKDPEVYEEVKQYVYKEDENYSVDFIKKTPTERTFAIDDPSIKEVEVYNTEQLFNVVQYGLRPVFTTGSEIAKTVYLNAKNELKNINNSDYLTDYEKALNIYRYICCEVSYDWVTYEFMKEIDDMTISSFGDYSCFYLEGVFYNLEKQYAVCDGLSKAYTLLCKIEGIDCVKVNGTADGAGHAWNKIYLVDDEYNVNGWYNVDTTWGVANYVAYNQDEAEYFEILTHTYFLDGDYSGRNIRFEGEVEDEPLEFNYYKNTNFAFEQTTGNLYIESDQELKDVFEYAEYNLNNGKNSIVIEIEIDVDFYDDGSDEESPTNTSLKYLLEELTADKKHLNQLIDFETANGNLLKVLEYQNKLIEVENKISNWFVLNGIADEIRYEWIICDEVFMFRFFK